MKSLRHIIIALTLLLISCNNQPKKLSNKVETIDVAYVNWACDCANFIDLKTLNSYSDHEIKAEDCFFIEPESKELIIPDVYYNTTHFKYYLKLHGQFYEDKGVPSSYTQKTELKPDKAKVFRYSSFEFVKK